MRQRYATARLAAGILAVVFGLSCLTPSSGAADDSPTGVSRTLKAQGAARPATGTKGRPFFKTKKGIVAAVLMVGALGWLAYTKSHDRVMSPANR